VTLTLHDDRLRRNLLRNILSTVLNKLQIFRQSRPFPLPHFEKYVSGFIVCCISVMRWLRMNNNLPSPPFFFFADDALRLIGFQIYLFIYYFYLLFFIFLALALSNCWAAQLPFTIFLGLYFIEQQPGGEGRVPTSNFQM
jgi:hypothetical protein